MTDYTSKSNIVLIGMPGSGKSTVGIILAKMMAKNFVDTDVLIQLAENRTLQEIVDSEGHMELRHIEERVLLDVNHRHHVIATGGSAAYSHKAMTHLAQDGIIVFLNADLSCLRSRIQNYETRGLAKRPDQTFQDLFDERYQLYTRYANIIVDCSLLSQEEVCNKIIVEIRSHV
ncbi:shikimate kinase [Desulfopila aestuarii]|uniref:Shikimate kinase n=1 Tax=Desulfopila aestuarii DSM 18488 TaxID=1121416 RepID=A0A1M7YDC4_9BACT|nr:shikimate kinase [Desulfopila aestuarii]SHO50642.1 shikimate kinase [Desulfopila aestuarii DSM 18488]